MTWKLHLPIPMMILSGPLYRVQLSVMTLLFISTVLLTGPVWCSHLCYFGAFDNLSSAGKTHKGKLRHKRTIKATLLLLIIASTILMRWFNIQVLITTLIAIGFAVIGIFVMVVYSHKKRKMVHCTGYCPIGTVVNILSFSPVYR
jgi:polyferredoxin